MRSSRLTECHPDRKHKAHGLCDACYRNFRFHSSPKLQQQLIDWRKANPDRIKIHERNIRIRRRIWLDNQKNKPCMDCGNSYPPECMDFDHVRGKKEFELYQARNMNLQKVLLEIAKCDLVCANCHRIRTTKRVRDKYGDGY